MATSKPVPVKSEPGIRRDGTQFDGKEYGDGLWCRFYRGRPKKMGGYRAVTSVLPEIVRGINSFTQNSINYIALGGASTLSQVTTDPNGNFTGINSRIPAAFASDPNNLWQMDTFFSTIGASNQLIAHAGPNMADISSSVERPIYVGPVTTNAALVAAGMQSNSGGVCAVAPYLFGYGNNGRVDISAVNDYSTNNSAFVTGQKIVKGLPLRTGGGGPGAILWSLDSLVQMTFDAAITTGIPFRFNTVTDQTSILSSQGVVNFDGIYFWMGVDRFLMFNGVVREVPNTMNLSFFFDNINFAFRQKAFAFKIPRWGEIWFCAPLGNATECSHAIVYNVRENTWYDTVLPGGGRSIGLFPKVFTKPLMVDVVNDPVGGGFTLWQHETGTDRINGGNVQPIRSNFTTDEKDMIEAGIDKAMRVDVVEPDLVQVGALTLTVLGRTNARALDLESVSVTFPVSPTAVPDDQICQFSTERRLMRFKIESNTAGGDYYMGNTIAHIEPSDGRITQ